MEISKGNKIAIVFGATGLVGGFVVKMLLGHEAYQKVLVFGRRKVKLEHERLEQHIINFDKPEQYEHLVKGDDLFICLGTTMRQAGSREAFFRVDYTYALRVAQIALENKVNQLLLVSSVGANADSFFFYNRVKGLLENAVRRLPFWSVHIFRPSILIGERNENRWGEQLAGEIGRRVDSLTGGLLTKYRPIEAEVVAKALITAAQGLTPGIKEYPSHYLQNLADEEEALRPYQG